MPNFKPDRAWEELTETIKKIPPSPHARTERFYQTRRELLKAVGFVVVAYGGYRILIMPAVHRWLVRTLDHPLPAWFRVLMVLPVVSPLFFLWEAVFEKEPEKKRTAWRVVLLWALFLIALYLWSQHTNPDVFDHPEYP